MKRFTVRVELHNVTDQNKYELLHQALTKKGFVNYITGDNSSGHYRLPPAEYNLIGSHNEEQVLNLAKSAAETVTEDYSVLVTLSAGRRWYNLTTIL